MHPDPDDREPWSSADLVEDAQGQLHGRSRLIAAQHDRVADRLHLLAAVLRKKLAHLLEELRRQLSRLLIAVGLGQRREAGQISKQEGVGPLLDRHGFDNSHESRRPGPPGSG